MRSRTSRSEAGETLAELLVTISIISISIVFLVGALGNSIALSSTHRQHATAETVARNVAEAIKDRDVSFVASGSYPQSIWTPSVDATGYQVVVSKADCWDGDINASPAHFGSCPASPDRGLQRVTITVTSDAKGEQEQLSILKRAS
jgi:type II secretory pathway pseudopilin PulG